MFARVLIYKESFTNDEFCIKNDAFAGSYTSFGLDHVITCWLGNDHALAEDEVRNYGFLVKTP